MRITQIVNVHSESPSVKTYTFLDKLCSVARPGQFLMLWIPGIDEIPLSIMDATNGLVSVSVKVVGDATRHLHSFEAGATIGIRGPFGKGFTESQGRVLLVGGGTGIAPLMFLAKQLRTKTEHLAFVEGAKTKEELLFVNELGGMCQEKNLITTTEDGTAGLQCLVTQPLASLLEKEHFDMIYTCGPEIMVKKIFEITEHHKLPLEASLERLMRCGIGLCGSCMIGKYRVCRDGPVFTTDQLREVKDELGISKIGFDGSRIPI
ncbi:MAG: dihydroorotate dehydrogenase electron transfer subunit [Nitrososphaerota archaeon]|jgi:dihydroorotate dehydrogenase electron transfer subunit|uniref:dihydroorotate dehydrogenase electron transfer subunit n=1 Tax=Candidatus Bathycorpusculum sp. TaxID=2994959 RepID=UPI002830911B|nr:dihydroorotate dehydrogenase electron transfer subunit [Candidatus Termitimicrobium sp.]MCL2431038.1 dihydroorotate dehydrogenase electron transfer subunit [Candidatus Termitimicrobium sp.]MDR0493743.1 dihydroorotate dehydrogenase electron transfer subunit [Nitrososphaerota archaeon]